MSTSINSGSSPSLFIPPKHFPVIYTEAQQQGAAASLSWLIRISTSCFCSVYNTYINNKTSLLLSLSFYLIFTNWFFSSDQNSYMSTSCSSLIHNSWKWQNSTPIYFSFYIFFLAFVVPKTRTWEHSTFKLLLFLFCCLIPSVLQYITIISDVNRKKIAPLPFNCIVFSFLSSTML